MLLRSTTGESGVTGAAAGDGDLSEAEVAPELEEEDVALVLGEAGERLRGGGGGRRRAGVRSAVGA
jgi:hypothetical protein